MQMMMAEGFTVRRDVRQAGPAVLIFQHIHQFPRKHLSVLKYLSVGDLLRRRLLIKKQIYNVTGAETEQIRPGRIHHSAFDVLPSVLADSAKAFGLVRTEDCKPDTVADENFEALHIDRRFRQPHPFRPASEVMLEIAYSPRYLCVFVPAVGQRHNNMVIGLSYGRAVPAECFDAFFVRFYYALINLRLVPGQPGQQSRPEIETHLRIIAYDVYNLVLVIEYPRRGVLPVTFLRYLLVPVMIRIGRILQLHVLQPGILPRRLIKMSVNAYVFIHQ